MKFAFEPHTEDRKAQESIRVNYGDQEFSTVTHSTFIVLVKLELGLSPPQWSVNTGLPLNLSKCRTHPPSLS